jgi:hypothetical protein
VYARSSTIKGDPGKLDDCITYVRDQAMPMIMQMDGCMGVSMIIDRDSGQCIATSSWRDEETMRASADNVTGLRSRMAEIMGGESLVDEWEAAVMHRDHQAPEGSCCRVTWMRLNHGDIDRGLDIYRNVLLPQIETMDGFCSCSLLINRESGRACGTVTFETRAQMESTREQGWALRDAGVREAGVDIVDVAEFDLALAHLGLPELV